MQNIISRHPNLTSPQGGSGSNSEKLVEQTILEFHARRRHLADCLKYIAEAAVAGQLAEMLPAGEVPDVLRQLYIFVADELLPGGTPAAMKEMGIQISTGRQQGDIGFPWRLLGEMDKVGETMAQVKVARQNARSETVGPGQGQGMFFISSAILFTHPHEFMQKLDWELTSLRRDWTHCTTSGGHLAMCS